MLLEGAKTNYVRWNRDLTNAVWTNTNITPLKDQTGIDGVANSASKITATANNGTIIQSLTQVSITRAQSAYVKRITGSSVVEMTMDNGTTWTAITVTSNWTKVSIPTQTIANPAWGFRLATSGDAIAIDFVQNENGIFSSSPIWVTTAAVARASDICQIAGAALSVFGSDYGAVIVQAKTIAIPAGNLAIVSGDNLNDQTLLSSSTNQVASHNGATSLVSGVSTVGAFKRAAFAWDTLTPSRRLQLTGGALQSSATAQTLSANQWLGSTNGTTGINFMLVQSLAFYNQNLSDAQLASKLTVDGSY